jgi:regulator of cell morphogenesis and NO signaling
MNQLVREVSVAMQDEEEIFFPYIKRIAHAFLRRESYGDLLMRTLRKPLKVIVSRNDSIYHLLNKIRLITSDYTPPGKACVTHKVTFYKLSQIDNDLRQHLYLENEVLIPKAIQIEKELLILNAP